MYEYEAQVLRVVDGDTLDLRVDLGFNIMVDMKVRLDGVNAPEMKTPEGKVAKAWVEAWVNLHGPVFTFWSTKDHQEKYGRYLGDLISINRFDHLVADIITAGQGVDYHGGKR